MIYSQRSLAALIALWVSLPTSSAAQGGEPKSLVQASRSKTLDRQARQVEELWADWSDMMRDYTAHQMSLAQDPEQQGWVSWFLGREGARTERLRSMTAELLGHLKESKAQDLKQRYFRLRDSIEAARLESVQLAEDSYLAPEDGEAWFFQNSKEDYKALIKAKKAAIQEMRREQRQLIQDCHDSLIQMGIELTEPQVKQLFQMKSGGAILDLLVTFAHLNLLLELLTERMSIDSTGELYAEESERYYSVYLALLGLSLDIHRETRRRLRHEDLKELDEQSASLKQMVKDTQSSIVRESKRTEAQSTDNIVLSYKENLKTQRELLNDLKEYRGLITEQLQSVKVVEAELQRQWDLALNTYKTARASRSYYKLVNRGLRDLNNLRKLKMPTMIPLMSERLSTKLKRLEEYRGKSLELRPQR